MRGTCLLWPQLYSRPCPTIKDFPEIQFLRPRWALDLRKAPSEDAVAVRSSFSSAATAHSYANKEASAERETDERQRVRVIIFFDFPAFVRQANGAGLSTKFAAKERYHRYCSDYLPHGGLALNILRGLETLESLHWGAMDVLDDMRGVESAAAWESIRTTDELETNPIVTETLRELLKK